METSKRINSKERQQVGADKCNIKMELLMRILRIEAWVVLD